jgi:hypothetical protein
MYLYRAIDSVGDTVEFYFSEQRDLGAAKRFVKRALERHGRPERIVVDGSQTNRAAIVSCDTTSRLRDRSRRRLKPIRTRQSQYLNNRIEQDHRSIKRRVWPMLGFKSTDSARTILAELAAIVGAGPLSRGEVVSKMWDYIKKHRLQNLANKREILADDKLEKIFGKPKVTMFEMNKHLAQHLR